MEISEGLCNHLADILGGKGMSDGKACSIMIERDLNAKILGKDLETEHEIVIQSLDRNGETLNTGEVVLLQNDIQHFIDAAREQGLLVTALHNHWLYEEPRLLY